MRVWRLAFGPYNHLDGEGARLSGGRWNSPGVPAVYAATHLTLAVLEQVVHFKPERMPSRLRAFVIDLPPDAAIEKVEPRPELVDDAIACRRVGDAWAASLRSIALVIPSVLIPVLLEPGGVATQERNVVLNPLHAAARAWRVVETSFRVDPRLASRRGTAGISPAR